jgi:hypothetical protein
LCHLFVENGRERVLLQFILIAFPLLFKERIGYGNAISLKGHNDFLIHILGPFY